MTFLEMISDVELKFTDSTWVARNINVVPDNYQGKLTSVDEYLTLSVLPSSSNNPFYGGAKAYDGTVILNMFVKAGEGQRRSMEISDYLDTLLQNQKTSTGLYFLTSFMDVVGIDSANKSLYNAKYIIPFTSYGD